MIDENFWNKYERMMSNPVTRFFNRSELRQMEHEINNSNEYLSSYDPESRYRIGSTSEYTNNMKKIIDKEAILKKQNSIVGKSFLVSSNKQENIAINLNKLDAEKMNFRSHYEDILRYQTLTTDVNNTLDLISKDLQSEGVYFTTELYCMNEIGESQIKIDYETNSKGVIEKNFGANMVGEELIDYAKNENLLTKTPVELQNKLDETFNKIDFSVDDVIYSYSNYVADFSEVDNVPTFTVFDDSNMPYETLKYEPESNRWKGVNYNFDIPNPVDDLKSIYKADAKTTEEIVEQILEPEMDDPRYDYLDLDNKEEFFMDNEVDWQPTFTLGELVKSVNEQENGLYQIPNSELTVADDRYFDLLNIEHSVNEKVLVLSTLEHEKDIFVVGPNEVKWSDNWSGEDDRVFKGDVHDKFKITFDDEMFDVNTNDLQFVKQMEAPVVELDIKSPMEQPTRSSFFGLDR